MTTQAPIEQSGKLAANQAIIRGRILEVNRTETAVRTDIVLPAADSYTAPQNVRVISNRLIGKPGEDVTVRCAIKGYRRKYQDKHGETAYSVDITLSAVEE